jgi:hypothetical protein
MILFESERPNLVVSSTNDEVIAQFEDGKFQTESKKIAKILRTLEGVHEVDLAGEEFFDSQKFEEKAEALKNDPDKIIVNADEIVGENE